MVMQGRFISDALYLMPPIDFSRRKPGPDISPDELWDEDGPARVGGTARSGTFFSVYGPTRGVVFDEVSYVSSIMRLHTGMSACNEPQGTEENDSLQAKFVINDIS